MLEIRRLEQEHKVWENVKGTVVIVSYKHRHTNINETERGTGRDIMRKTKTKR